MGIYPSNCALLVDNPLFEANCEAVVLREGLKTRQRDSEYVVQSVLGESEPGIAHAARRDIALIQGRARVGYENEPRRKIDPLAAVILSASKQISAG